jgi:hypothetical protein
VPAAATLWCRRAAQLGEQWLGTVGVRSGAHPTPPAGLSEVTVICLPN